MAVRLTDDPRYDARFVDVVEIISQENPYVKGTLNEVNLPQSGMLTYQFQRPITLKAGAHATTITLWMRTSDTPAYVTVMLVKRELGVNVTGVPVYQFGTGVERYVTVAQAATPTAYVVPLGANLDAGDYMVVLMLMNGIPNPPPGWVNGTVYVGVGGAGYAINYLETVDAFNNIVSRGDIMASPYFDIAFAESEITQDLGLVLGEGQNLQFSATWQSPFASQLGQGQVKEQDLNAYKVLTQNDWRGGRGLETAYQQPTDRFRDALLDTRFANMAVLPPMATRTLLAGGNEQSFTPNVTSKVNEIYAQYQSDGLSGMNFAQSFLTGASGYTLTTIRLKLEKGPWSGAYSFWVELHADDAGKPGAAVGPSFGLASQAELDATANGNPQYVRFINAYTLSANTKYWIVPKISVAAAAGNMFACYWHTGSTENYAGGSAMYQDVLANNNPQAWTAMLPDFCFICNLGAAAPSNITCNPVEFNGGWYIASGTGLYKFNTSTLVWNFILSLGTTVTALAVLGSKLYAALGDSTDMKSSSDGTLFAAVTGRKCTYLRAYSGYLYGLKTTGGSAALGYSADGTTWVDLTIGTSSTTPTGLVGFNNEIIITTTTGLYSLSASFVYQILDYSAQRSASNGKGATVWSGSGLLYVPVRNSLLAYNGQTTTQVGLDLGEGLPNGEQGRVSAMAGIVNWLFAAVDAGTGRSGIYAYNGSGWHCLVKAATTGNAIQAIGIEAVTATNMRLWYAEGQDIYYLELPTVTDNPYAYMGSLYQSSGYLNGSRWMGELSGIDKDLQSIVVRSEGCGTNQTIDVLIEVDRSGQWWNVGTIYNSPLQEIELQAAAMANKTTALGCTDTIIVVGGSSTLADMAAGAFVRIGAEVRQVVSVNSATQFTLNRALEAGAPTVGTTVYSSRPAGREVNYRLVLRTNDSTKTPKLLSVSIRYMEQLIDKARITLSVPVGDCQVWRNGARSDLTAQQLFDELVVWGKRLTPFFLVDPAGNTWRVKCAGSMTWSGVSRTADTMKARKVKGTMTYQLMEV